MPTQQPTFLGRLSIAMLIIVVGIPTGFLLVLGTWGTVLLPLVVAVYAVPLFLFHYVVWGRAYSRRVRLDGKRAGATSQAMDRWW